jgi:hypothetical protein
MIIEINRRFHGFSPEYTRSTCPQSRISGFIQFYKHFCPKMSFDTPFKPPYPEGEEKA